MPLSEGFASHHRGNLFPGRLVALALAATFAPAAIGAQPQPVATVLYVDSRIPAPSCASYNPAARSCTGGRDRAFQTLAGVVPHADAGTTVLIREGVFHEPLVPAASGTAERPIVFRNFERELVTLSNFDAPALQIIGREHRRRRPDSSPTRRAGAACRMRAETRFSTRRSSGHRERQRPAG